MAEASNPRATIKSLGDLPPEVILCIADQCDNMSLVNLSLTCGNFHSLTLRERQKRARAVALGPDSLYRVAFAYSDDAIPGIDPPHTIFDRPPFHNAGPEWPWGIPRSNQLFAWAVYWKMIDMVRFFLDAGVNPNTYSTSGRRMLSLAVPSIEMVSLLLNYGADVNALDVDDTEASHTLLRHAARSNHEVAKLLISRGANLHEYMVMHDIVLCADMSTINMALEHGGPLVPAGETETTILHAAVQRGEADVFDLILSQDGIDPNAQDSEGYTPLHLAMQNPDPCFALPLIEAGADMDAQGLDGYTPLHLALERRHWHVAEMLIERGCRLNVLNQNLESELHLALSGPSLHIVQLLLDHHADVNVHSDIPRNATPMHYAIRTWDFMNVCALLKGPTLPDLTIEDEYGYTAWETADLFNHADIIEILKEYY